MGISGVVFVWRGLWLPAGGELKVKLRSGDWDRCEIGKVDGVKCDVFWWSDNIINHSTEWNGRIKCTELMRWLGGSKSIFLCYYFFYCALFKRDQKLMPVLLNNGESETFALLTCIDVFQHIHQTWRNFHLILICEKLKKNYYYDKTGLRDKSIQTKCRLCLVA